MTPMLTSTGATGPSRRSVTATVTSTAIVASMTTRRKVAAEM